MCGGVRQLLRVLRAITLAVICPRALAQPCEPIWQPIDRNGQGASFTGHAVAYDPIRGRTLLFAASSPAQLLEWDGRRWSVRAGDGPSPRSKPSLAFDSSRDRAVLFGGQWVSTSMADTWEWSGDSWAQVATTGPSARSGACSAYDQARQRTVLFGGGKTSIPFTDTWEWDGAAWLLKSSSGPGPSTVCAMAYDPSRGRVVLFQPGFTWEWTGGAWNLLTLTGPAVSVGAALLAYDGARGSLILLSVASDIHGAHDQMWDLGPEGWSLRADVVIPMGRESGMIYDSARQRIVLAGRTRANSGYDSSTWEWDGFSWTQADDPSPSAREGAAMAFDLSLGVSVLFGGGDRSYGTWLGDTWTWDGRRWDDVSNFGPAARLGAGMVPDPSGGGVLLSGGRGDDYYDDLWRWNGSRWTFLNKAFLPRRGHHAIAADPLRRRVVVFGGKNFTGQLADTWEWTGHSWDKIADTGPSARDGAACAYDPVSQRVILYGGQSGDAIMSDTWAWDGVQWSQRPISGPEPLRDASLAYDGRIGSLVLYGGSTGSNIPSADAYVLGPGGWVHLDTEVPEGRSGAAMSFDPTREQLLIFGGRAHHQFSTVQLSADLWRLGGPGFTRPMPNTAPRVSELNLAYDAARHQIVAQAASQTWLWDGDAWTQTPSSPPVDTYTAIAYDAARQRVVLYGGFAGIGGIPRSDTWEWDGIAWTKVNVVGPGPRMHHAMAYDAQRQQVILCGGDDGTASFLNDTWVYDGAAWKKAASGGPAPRYDRSIAYDASRHTVLVFGGYGPNSQWYNDTWEWNGIKWTKLAVSGPSPRSHAAMDFDTVRRRMVLQGGWGPDGLGLGDSWAFENGAWRQLLPAAHPPAMTQPFMVYFPPRDQMLAFICSPSSFGEDWLLTPPQPPVFSLSPAQAQACTGGTMTMRVAVTGARAPAYQWLRDGSPLSDGPAPGGGLIRGSATPILTIEGVLHADLAAYACRATGICGEIAESAPADLVICLADIDCSGFVDTDDLDLFLEAFLAGDPAADVDRSGFVDEEDGTLFFAAFDAGC